jgi:hypothetical protein
LDVGDVGRSERGARGERKMGVALIHVFDEKLSQPFYL